VPELTERACGVLEGTPIAHNSPFAKACAAAGKPFGQFAPEGGESLMQVQDRILRFFSTLYEKHAGQRIALVSSGAAIAMLLLGILKREVNSENYRALKHDNAGFSKLFFSDSETCQLLCLNRTNHL
jgi:broad specificity phosphatase PhoE